MRPFPQAAIALLLCLLAPLLSWAQQIHCQPCGYNFGKVQIGDSSTYSFVLTNTGTRKTLKILSISEQGTAYSVGNLQLPVEVQPGASIEVPVTFTPTGKGETHGVLAITSNAPQSPLTLNVYGDGAGQSAPQVDLTWNSGGGDAAGYNIFRGNTHGGPYEQINSALDTNTNYTDYNVVAGATYYYVTTEVDTQGEQSGYSNEAEVTIPAD